MSKDQTKEQSSESISSRCYDAATIDAVYEDKMRTINSSLIQQEIVWAILDDKECQSMFSVLQPFHHLEFYGVLRGAEFSVERTDKKTAKRFEVARLAFLKFVEERKQCGCGRGKMSLAGCCDECLVERQANEEIYGESSS